MAPFSEEMSSIFSKCFKIVTEEDKFSLLSDDFAKFGKLVSI